ncbi:MAG: hypothetical protein WCF57_05915 [Pyrinomonadaceae bacterium]
MKIKTLSAALLAILCCFIFSSETKGQSVDGYTSIDYDESSGIVDAYSETSVDYDVATDYQAYVLLQVLDDYSSLVTSLSARDYNEIGFISVEAQFYGQPGSTYTAKGTHRAWAMLYDYDYDYDYYPYRPYYYYYDVWYFGFYEPYYIYRPWYSYFTNNGFQNIRRRNRFITLGTTHDSASVTVGSAKPHHLVVVVDQTTYNSCGSKRRDTLYRVVTASGRLVPDASVRETFPAQNDTCNGSTVSPSDTCTPTSNGTFQDAVSVGCPFTDSACGFADTNRWQWCPPTGSPVTIGTLRCDVRPYRILINGAESFNSGQIIRR